MTPPNTPDYEAKLKENTAQLREYFRLNKYDNPDLIGLVRTAMELNNKDVKGVLLSLAMQCRQDPNYANLSDSDTVSWTYLEINAALVHFDAKQELAKLSALETKLTMESFADFLYASRNPQALAMMKPEATRGAIQRKAARGEQLDLIEEIYRSNPEDPVDQMSLIEIAVKLGNPHGLLEDKLRQVAKAMGDRYTEVYSRIAMAESGRKIFQD